MEKELKDTLVALTRSLVSTTQTAFAAQEMAMGVYGFISSRHPNMRTDYDKALQAATKLYEQRDQQLKTLEELLAKVQALS
jgi:hypothetical protein